MNPAFLVNIAPNAASSPVLYFYTSRISPLISGSSFCSSTDQRIYDRMFFCISTVPTATRYRVLSYSASLLFPHLTTREFLVALFGRLIESAHATRCALVSFACSESLATFIHQIASETSRLVSGVLARLILPGSHGEERL